MGYFQQGEAVGVAHGVHWIGFVRINCYPDPRKFVQSKHFQIKNQDVQAYSLPPECATWHQSLQIPTKLSRHMWVLLLPWPSQPPRAWGHTGHGLWGLSGRRWIEQPLWWCGFELSAVVVRFTWYALSWFTWYALSWFTWYALSWFTWYALSWFTWYALSWFTWYALSWFTWYALSWFTWYALPISHLATLPVLYF